MSKVLVILGACVALALFGGFAWQQSEKSSSQDAAAHHEKIASSLDSAVTSGTAAGALLGQYVQTGDQTLLPQMQAKTDEGVRGLTSAMSEAGGDPNGFVQTGSAVVQRSGQIVALRQSGDVAGAAAALSALSTDFGAFVQAQQTFVASERASAATSTSSADDAGQLATWFLIAGVIACVAVVGGVGFSFLRRGPARAIPA